MLDLFIYKIGAIILALSFFNARALIPVLLLCATFIANQITFNLNPTWESLEYRALAISLVNFAFGVILITRLKTPEFIIGLSFVVCSLYHQWMLVEIQNHVLSLKHSRSDFMIILTALQLATIIFILIQGSHDNGGKRAKHYISIAIRGFYSFLHHPTYNKVTK